ncbi:MAG: hypothetical protein JXP34_11575, partial [Planctomycetes bacterium]|nr:hypothetical protein [Planctomycetota bacterium]
RPTKLSPDSRGAMPGDSIAGIPSPSFLIRVVSSRTLYPIDGSLVRGEDIDGRELFRATTSPSGLVAIPLRLVHGALSGEPQRARAGHEMSLRLSAKADGHADSCVSVPMASLAAAETYQLALHPALLVEGVVEGAHGEPLGSAGVVGEWYGKDGLRGYGGVSETDTQPDGTFSLPLGETVRKARLLAFRPDFAPAIVSLDFRGRSIPPVRIVLDEPGLVSGWVYSLAGKPMPSACVRLRSARLEWGNGALLERLLNAFGNRCVDRAWTDAFGAFRIEGIGCGTYSVTCQLDGWELSGHPIDLVVPAATECLVLLRPCPEAHPLIPPDIDEAALPATLSVRLRRGDGLLAAGTLCCAVRNAFGETDCSTARIRAGRAAIEVPATGFFDAVFSVEGFRPVSQMGLRSQDFREGALDIDLDVGIRVQGMLSVNGTRGGLLRPGILSLMDPETRLALQVARFDREGRFSLEHVEPRPYVAEVRMGAGLFAVTDVFEIRDGEVLISAEDSSEEVGLNP